MANFKKEKNNTENVYKNKNLDILKKIIKTFGFNSLNSILTTSYRETRYNEEKLQKLLNQEIKDSPHDFNSSKYNFKNCLSNTNGFTSDTIYKIISYLYCLENPKYLYDVVQEMILIINNIISLLQDSAKIYESIQTLNNNANYKSPFECKSISSFFEADNKTKENNFKSYQVKSQGYWDHFKFIRTKCKSCKNTSCIFKCLYNTLFLVLNSKIFETIITSTQYSFEETTNPTLKEQTNNFFDFIAKTKNVEIDNQFWDNITLNDLKKALKNEKSISFLYPNPKEYQIIYYKTIKSAYLLWLDSFYCYYSMWDRDEGKYENTIRISWQSYIDPNGQPLYCTYCNNLLPFSLRGYYILKNINKTSANEKNILKTTNIENNLANYIFTSYLNYDYFLHSYIESLHCEYYKEIERYFNTYNNLNILNTLQYKLIFNPSSLLLKDSKYGNIVKYLCTTSHLFYDYTPYKLTFHTLIKFITFFIYSDDTLKLSVIQFMLSTHKLNDETSLFVFILLILSLNNNITYETLLYEIRLAYPLAEFCQIIDDNLSFRTYLFLNRNDNISSSYRIFVYSNYYENLYSFNQFKRNTADILFKNLKKSISEFFSGYGFLIRC